MVKIKAGTVSLDFKRTLMVAAQADLAAGLLVQLLSRLCVSRGTNKEQTQSANDKP